MREEVQHTSEDRVGERYAQAVSAEKARSLGRLALLSLSVANVFFLGLWRPILAYVNDPGTRFPENRPPGMAGFGALLFDIAALALLLFLAGIASRARLRPLRIAAFAFLAFWYIVALYRILESAGGLVFRVVHRYDLVSIFQIALTLGILIWLRFSMRRMAHAAEALFLILFPLLPVLAADGLWSYATLNKARFSAGHVTAQLFPVAPERTRAIWIVFDELDKGFLFDSRPARLHLPEFDRLKSGAIFAEHAVPPGSETLQSMPALLLGRTISGLHPDADRFSIKFVPSGPWVNFSSEPNVFRQAKLAGLNTGVTGWYIPYCRLIGNDLNACSWGSIGSSALCAVDLMEHRSLSERALYLLRWNMRMVLAFLVPTTLDPIPDDALIRRYAGINATRIVEQNADRMLRDPNLNFILIHVPAPHPPGIWNQAQHRFELANTDSFDNYELADDILGKIRRTLEERGEWNNAAVLVTSDHPFRPALWKSEQVLSPEMEAAARFSNRRYVPFLLKLPNQTAPMVYRDQFPGVLSGELLLGAITKPINDDQAAVEWISAHAKSPAVSSATQFDASGAFE